MRLLLAIFLPFLSFFTIGRPIAALLCLILQITVLGWIPAALWAVFALGQWNTDQKIKRALQAAQKPQAPHTTRTVHKSPPSSSSTAPLSVAPKPGR